MAWTTPGTATAGEVLTAAFWNTQVRDNMLELAPLFTGWTTYTPTLYQTATTPNITKSGDARYMKLGNLLFLSCALSATGTGTAGGGVGITLPSGITLNHVSIRVGSGMIFDNSTSTRYAGVAETFSASGVTYIGLVGDWSGTGLWGSNPNIAIASGDQFALNVLCQCTI